MVNALKKVYNKTPWQQKRLSKPLDDPNYVSSPLHQQQHSSLIEDDEQLKPDSLDPNQQQFSTPPPQQQISYNNSNNNTNDNSISNTQQPPRRGITRADTKISLRKSKKDSRRVFLNIPPPTRFLDKNGLPKTFYSSNRISTAKYTVFSFLPKNLFEQFRRVANMFFLFMAIIQLTPIFTVGSPFLTVFPLCFVVGVTAIKDGFEDYKRHVEDRNFNQRLCLQIKNTENYNFPTSDSLAAQRNKSIFSKALNAITHGSKKTSRALNISEKPSPDVPLMDLDVLTSGDSIRADNSTVAQPEFEKEQWANLRVGDFIKLENNQAVPADAIILSTSEAEGSCFVETKDLDGETNLKTRISLHETSKYNTARRCSRLKCYIDMEPINANLFSFNGSLTMVTKKRNPGDQFGGVSGQSANNRYSQYAASITSSMMSSVRGSLEDQRESFDGTGNNGEGNSEVVHDAQLPAQGGTSASDYARLHKSASYKRRSRFSELQDLPTSEQLNDDKQEYEEPTDVASHDDRLSGLEPSSLRATISKRSSLHRSATAASGGGMSGMAKNILRANYEQQLHQHQQSQAGVQITDSVMPQTKEKTIPVDINNMLLRGHVIRNTHWVIAVIVATGTDTKIMLNSGETPSKRSRIEKTMNVQVAINFAILLILCIVCAVGSTINDRRWRKTGAADLWDMSSHTAVIDAIITFFTSLIIFQNIIPISLYISIEFVKTFQAFFIWKDSDMYDIELDQFCTPKTWNLTDDLGQIEYVFSDKTGTLTRNIMEFKKCSINGKIYGNNAVSGQTDAEKGLELMNNDQDPSGETGVTSKAAQQPQQNHKQEKDAILKEYDQEIRKTFEPTYMDPLESLSFADPALLRDMNTHGNTSSESRSTTTANSSGEGSSSSPLTTTHSTGLPHDGSPANNIRDFFTLLALCHTVVVEQPEEEIEEDDDDDFGVFDDNGEAHNNNNNKHLGLRERLKLKTGGAGLVSPSSTGSGGHGSGNRSRKNSNAASTVSVPKVIAGSKPATSLDEQEKTKPVLRYRAESPDEAALVSAAKNVGFVFVSRGAAAAGAEGEAKAGGNSRQNVNVNFLGQDHTYEQLDVIKFNSTRKRMTVIVREPQELGGKILLLTKGADNVIFERLSQNGSDHALRDQTEQDIEAFSNMGLRTLTLAQRVLDQETYDAWSTRYAEAGKALNDRAKKVDQVAEEIEKDLTLIGATAIEDKLQDGVPDSIAALREAGIKVWVLTGDKLETAINIGFASRLLEKDMQLEIMKMGRNEAPESVLKRFKELVEGVLSGRGSAQELTAAEFNGAGANGDKEELNEESGKSSPPQTHGNTWGEKSLPTTPTNVSLMQDMDHKHQYALIVDGSALKILLDDPEARKDLIKLSDVCFSVICCRASPLQKALVVELIRRGKKTVCLAIGDGANDVSMIQAANIGVGIAGQEGMQAAMASDYSITQFRFIRKLVLVHGHWGYMRIAEMILNFFFKNVLWVGAVLWFQIYCGFSGMLFYDYTFVSLYNLMLTSVPVLVLGATDQDLTAPYVLRFPGVYKLGIHQKRYNQSRFVAYMLDGVWQSLVVFWFWRGVYGVNVLDNSGTDASLLELSTSVAITNVVIASIYIGLHSYHWTWIMHFAVWGSIVFLVLMVVVYGAFTSSPIYGVAIRLFGEGSFWFNFILSVVSAFLVRYTVLFVSFWWFPDDVHVARGIMISEKRNAKAHHVKWTGLAPDGMTPQGQSEQEKAILRKEDEAKRIKKEEKAEKLAAKNLGKKRTNKENQDDDQPYNVPDIQINVEDQSQGGGRGAAISSNRPQTPVEIQQSLLQAQKQYGNPEDPNFKFSRRTSSYNYESMRNKPAALPPVPSPSLPSLPSGTNSRANSAASSTHSLHLQVPTTGDGGDVAGQQQTLSKPRSNKSLRSQHSPLATQVATPADIQY
ncbi:hypothetical protein BGZ46_007983 [Entomortierella lignicola]|nr:hypothetical protein BGZ46_007983 [Entomortierella lignicola]